MRNTELLLVWLKISSYPSICAYYHHVMIGTYLRWVGSSLHIPFPVVSFPASHRTVLRGVAT